MPMGCEQLDDTSEPRPRQTPTAFAHACVAERSNLPRARSREGTISLRSDLSHIRDLSHPVWLLQRCALVTLIQSQRIATCFVE